ncbi:MAG: saccharopine dehydrogenase family protein [Candidatus Limnocylindria bacterium]
MARVIVLGVGMVGRAMALDLARRHEVLACDQSGEALARLSLEAEAQELFRPLRTCEVDATDEAAVGAAVPGFDLAVTAVPGRLGFRTLRAVIETGTPVTDISFGPEDSIELDALARERGSCAIVDIGVAPGLDGLILGHYDQMWQLSEFECLVGGLPLEPSGPWRYKAPFSPADVVEEYVRPARQMEDGRVVIRPALSEPELVEISGIGTLEAFNTDGLRTILSTMSHIPNMREKTLRWPGHRELALALRESGLLSEDPIAALDAAGNLVTIVPREVTSRLLFEQWALRPGEREFTAMRVTLRGVDRQTGAHCEAVYELLDRTDPASGTSSMARATGYTCTAAAELILSGTFRTPGVHPGERLGAVPGVLDRVLAHLEQRGVRLRATVSPAEPSS